MRRLLVFCKEPQPGRVKTRLAASIGDEAAADLAWSLLRDTCRLARIAADQVDARLELHHAPASPSPAFRELGASFGCLLVPQIEGSLGERLAAGLAPEGDPRVALGSDAPDLPPGQIVAAFEGLDPQLAVASPAPDGGYVLLGLGSAVPALALGSAQIRWSSESTLRDTRASLEASGARFSPPLAGWRDVDEWADLEALADRLGEDPSSAPASAAWLRARNAK